MASTQPSSTHPLSLVPYPSPVRWRWVILAALILALLAEVSGGLLGLKWLSAMSPHLQFLLLCAAIVCLIIAFAERPFVSRGPFGSPSLRSGEGVGGRGWFITRHALLITFFGLALLLRLWHNADAIRTLVDEMNFVSGMTNFWKPDPVGILTPMDNISPFTWIFPYWQADFVALVGRNMAAIRAVSAVVGALNIPALYLLVATLFNRKIALVAAFLLAVFPPHIHFSRIALLSITDPLMGTLALAFLARGLKHCHRLDYALAGIFLGLTQYFFEGGRLLFIPLAAAWLVAVWLFARPRKNGAGEIFSPSLRSGEGGLFLGTLCTVLCAVLLAAPIYYTLFAIHKPLTGRMDASGLGAGFWNDFSVSPVAAGLKYLVNHLAPAIRIYTFLPDQTRYYGGDTALILPVLVPFFVVGLIVVLRGIRSPGNLLLLLWIFAVSLGNSLLQVSAATTRYVVVFPALALTIALGLCAALDWLSNRFLRASTTIPDSSSPSLVRSLPVGRSGEEARGRGYISSTQHLLSLITRNSLLITILILLAAYQLAYYFGTHLARFDVDFRETRPNHDIEDAVYRALDFPPDTQVHIIGRGKFDVGYGLKFAAFFRDDLPTDGDTSANVTADWLTSLSRTVDQAFFIETEDIETLTLLQAVFKSALEGPYFSPYNVAPERQFILFYVRHVP